MVKTARSTRVTSTHIFFWGGPMSNWWDSPPFSGQRCLDLLLPRLDNHPSNSVKHPSPDAFSTYLIAKHTFTCGEQFLMAMKPWLFERPPPSTSSLSEQDTTSLGTFDLEKLRQEMLSHKFPPRNTPARAMYDSTLCKILRARSAKDQKVLGRGTLNFQEEIWNIASIEVCVSCSIARAEVDDELKHFYLACGKRKFVEGSPIDKIWGVGIKWDDHSIDDEANWKGQNRLGRCHDAASVEFRTLQEKKLQDEVESGLKSFEPI